MTTETDDDLSTTVQDPVAENNDVVAAHREDNPILQPIAISNARNYALEHSAEQHPSR